MLVCLGLVAAGCQASPSQSEVDYKPTEVYRATAAVAGNERLGVRIGTPATAPSAGPERETAGSPAGIRRAEAYYVAVRLKDAMQVSGHWGTVRVVPANGAGGDVSVTGAILESDGGTLRIQVTVADATGARWFTEEYSGAVDEATYEAAQRLGTDPFDYLYNRIANEIAFHLAKMSPEALARIRRVSEFRYASSLAPDDFSGHLAKVPGKKAETPDMLRRLVKLVGWDAGSAAVQETTYEVVRPGSQDDIRLRRAEGIRARERQLVDILDRQYSSFAGRMSDTYTNWRLACLRTTNATRGRGKTPEARVGETLANSILGMFGAMGGASQDDCRAGGDPDAEIAGAALEGLAMSLSSGTDPVFLEVDGETVELTGAPEEKFEQWRTVRKSLYERGVGPLRVVPPSNAIAPIIEVKQIRLIRPVRHVVPIRTWSQPGPPLRIPSPGEPGSTRPS